MQANVVVSNCLSRSQSDHHTPLHFLQKNRAWELMQTATSRLAFALKTTIRLHGYARRRASLMFVGFILSTSSLRAQSSFQAIGDLPGGGFQSVAHDVSSDGSVVVGASETPSGTQPFRWTQSDGIQSIGTNNLFGFALGTAVSGDGSVIVGNGFLFNFDGAAFYWTAADGLTLITEGSPSSAFDATDVSTNGVYVVGTRYDFVSREAYRWTKSGGVQLLGDLAGGANQSLANAVSADGSVVVGLGNNANGADEATRWTQSTGMTGLGFLPGKDYRSVAYDVSDDGTVIVGQSYSGNLFNSTSEAFRWTQATGMIGLGDLPGGGGSFANAVSGDGLVVVGSSATGFGSRAWRWTESGGMISLHDWLAAAGVSTAGFSVLESAQGVNRDGSIVVGYGQSNNGQEGFIARVGSGSSGFVGLADLRNSLSSQSATHVQLEILNSLALNGAHHKPLMDFGAQKGSISGWTIGDLGRVYNAGDGQLQLAEIGVFRDLADKEYRLGGGTGYSHGTINQRYGGLNRLSGEYGLVELDRNIMNTGLIASVLGLAGRWDADIRRGYSAGASMSSGRTDLCSNSIRARLDWRNAIAIRQWSFSPMSQFTVTNSNVGSYQETGGTAPASFESQNHTASESRLGMTAGHPLSEGTNLFFHSEWAHRFDHESSRVSGIANVLDTIAVPYSFAGNRIREDWMRFRSELVRDINATNQVSTAGTVATTGQDPDLTLSLQWTSSF